MLLLPSKFFEKKYIFFFLFLFCAISTDRLDAFTKTASVEIAERRAENSTTPKEKKMCKWKKEKKITLLKNPNSFQRVLLNLALGTMRNRFGPARLAALAPGHVAGGKNRRIDQALYRATDSWSVFLTTSALISSDLEAKHVARDRQESKILQSQQVFASAIPCKGWIEWGKWNFQ